MNKLSQFFAGKADPDGVRPAAKPGPGKVVVETYENGILAASLVDDKNQVVSRITSASVNQKRPTREPVSQVGRNPTKRRSAMQEKYKPRPEDIQWARTTLKRVKHGGIKKMHGKYWAECNNCECSTDTLDTPEEAWAAWDGVA